MRDRIRIVHTSDIHLDLNPVVEPFPQFVERCFEMMIETTIRLQADLLLIAGDFFDHNRVSQRTVDLAVEQFRRLPIPVVLLPGNHDAYEEGSVYHRSNLEAACDNLTLLTNPEGQHVVVPDLDLAIWGKPTVDHSPDFRPLDGLPPKDSLRWYIAVGHGLFVGDDNQDRRSSPIMTQEIATAQCDYIALGHTHIFTNVSQGGVTACYSGSPTGDGFLQAIRQLAVVELDRQRGVRVETVTLPEVPR